VLRAGGVVAYPTDTFYGLAVDPRSDEAVRRLYEVKGREEAAAIALIAADAVQAYAVGDFLPGARRLAQRFWPGPLTIVVPMAPGLSRRLSGERRTIGVRVPAHPAARALALAVGFAITATSANRSGTPATCDPAEVVRGLGDRIDVLLDAGATRGGPPSTLVEVVVAGPPVLHRAGAVAWERVLESLE